MRTLYRYRFGNATFDESKFELTVGGLPVDAQPLPMQILALLLSRGGELVTREEIFETVWHGRRTVDNALANAVTKLRNALGEQCSVFIENVPRVGFRFAGRFERSAVGRIPISHLDFKAGDSIPFRDEFRFERLLDESRSQEVWLGTNVGGYERRVYKFAADTTRVTALKREVTVSRLLRDQLGSRDDIVSLLSWNFSQPPYYVESAFGGEDLLAWATENLAALSPDERLSLLARIGDAVAAAHSVGVLHKDLKPKNVLVAGASPHWQIRLVDFGSSKILDSDRLQRLGITSFGVTSDDVDPEYSTRGTLLYLAPELLRDQAATVRSDLYALGVLCYQLLVGDLNRPFAPGWESDISDELLRADLARACSRLPEDRFTGVEAFIINLRSLQRRHDELTVSRSAQRQIELDQEMLRRARVRRPWIAATIICLGVGLAVSLGLYARMRAAREAQARDYLSARSLSLFLTRDFIAVANPSVTGRRDVTVIDAARSAAGKIDATFGSVDPVIRAGLHASMQQALHGLSEYEAAIAEGRKALEAYSAARVADARVADAQVALAYDLVELSRLQESSDQLAAAATIIHTQHLQNSAIGVRYWFVKGGIDADRLDLPKALENYRRAWTMSKQSSDLSPDLRDSIEFALADTLNLLSHSEEAARQAASLLSSQQGRLGPGHPRTCLTEALLARINIFRHQFDSALPLAEDAATCLTQALGPNNSRTLSAHEIIADLHFATGDFKAAAADYTQLAQDYTDLLGPAVTRTVNARTNAGVALQYGGRRETGEQELAATLASAQSTLSWNNPNMEALRFHLADCLLEQHKTDDVPRLLEGLTSEVLSEGETEDDWDGELAFARGRLALYLGDRPRALELLEAAEGIIAVRHSDGHIAVAKIRSLIEQVKAESFQKTGIHMR